MFYLVLAFLTSLSFTSLLVFSDHLHMSVSGDHDLDGVQKFHYCPVPRIGGCAIFISLFSVLLLGLYRGTDWFGQLAILLAASLPAFLAGLLEDFTKQVSGFFRLFATMIAAIPAYYFLDAGIVRLDLPYLDLLIKIPFISLCFTMLAVAGVANAFNIIDGFNGLASVVAIVIFSGLAYVSFLVGDWFLVVSNIGMIGACSGFLIWNYPRGLIFLGDGGAYFIGFMVAELSILLIVRHPTVSIWFPLMLCMYPVFETLFTMYRRAFVKGTQLSLPDRIHLHTLIYRRVVRLPLNKDILQYKVQRNALTAPYLWVISSFAAIPAVVFWNNSFILFIFVIVFSVSYVFIYKMIVNFKVPSWLVIKK
jgi:UDP-N-acetylmuramyl pentapeptide phosphotransferase/UDP-N-acetylglucosamine-1-phosphate transferase